ncbi:MAG: serine/threonine protein kinase [Clostridium sp.]|nr:serine/threonine protein kinase [Clostridium sp.]
MPQKAEVKGLKKDTILKGKTHSYRIIKILGSGSFGITYLADVIFADSLSNSSSLKVTIKEFFMRDVNGREGSSVTAGSRDGLFGKYLSKFNQEANKLSTVNSDGVVKVLELFQANNTSYYVMQYLSGGSLDNLISNRGHIPEKYALQIGLQIANALSDIHEKLMLHLDLKPSNVMLSATGNAVLIDFGLSKQYTEEGEPESSTTVGAGTKGYAPIEQAQYRDGHDFPATMDIYAFGGTLFKMLTGQTPPASSYILNDGFPTDLFKQAGVSSIVTSFVERLMSPTKKGRPQDMSQVISEIQSIGSRINMADEEELSGWITKPVKTEISSNNETKVEETDIEIVSVSEKKIESRREASFDPAIDKLEIKVIPDPETASDYSWFSITATPSQFMLVKSKRGEQHQQKKKFFFSKEKFDLLKQQLSKFELRCEPNAISALRPSYGVSLETYKGNQLDFYASSYDDGLLSGLLSGKISELESFAWRESGLENTTPKEVKTGPLAKIKRFVCSPLNWIGYLAVFGVVLFFYVISDPLDEYIDTYKTDVYNTWRSTYDYQLRAAQGGKGGILYIPAKQWVVSPNYVRSNPEDIYVSNNSFTLDGVKLYGQQNGYALIRQDSTTKLFFKGNLIAEFPYSGFGDVSKVHRHLYSVDYYDEDARDMFYAIYDENGEVVIPVTDKTVRVIADNVIRVEDYFNTDYYDITGRPITSFNIVVLYDKHKFLMDLVAYLVLSIIMCVLARFGYKAIRKKYAGKSKNKLAWN